MSPFRICVVLVAFLLFGCSATTTTPKTHYYLLTSQQPTVSTRPLAPLPHVQVECAAYLSQAGLVNELPQQQIETAHYHRWAEPLPAMMRRYLQRALQQRCPDTALAPDVTLVVDQFHHLSSGAVVFAGQWWSASTPPVSFALKQATPDNSYPTTVAALQDLLNLQADQIARTLCPTSPQSVE
jgi:uncharacterized lipoprotein YmbA